jgi:hypothetical protein
MTRWHASTDLHETTAAVVAKMLHLAARLENGLGLGLESDTSG